ncbi:hypothetical protein ACPB9J_31855 [Streptomyces lavendulocolor]|uniref:hypothetical protein n=1 Tax=Streptomyces lavendulocolor TaxID=67316 RepID=UPI003C2B93C0
MKAVQHPESGRAAQLRVTGTGAAAWLLAKGLAMGFDKRQVQTAVLGSPDSDEAVLCPTEVDELEAFLAEYRNETFWCGILLRGCGGRLMARRGNEGRVSHFAHYPDPHGLLPPCGRRTHGASGADHLYVKSATKAWLRQQGHTPRYHFIDRDDAPVGSVVDIDLNGQTLRIHMDRSLPPDWDADDVGELILGPGVPVSPARLARLGYVNRVKFASDGSTRVLEFGTEVPREGTRWGFSVSDCEITADGRLKTPVVAQIWVTEAQRPSVPASPSAPTARANLTALDNTEPRVPHQIGALIRRIHTAIRDKETSAVRRLRLEAERELPWCEGAALAHLQREVDYAGMWLTAQDRIREVLFTRLKDAAQNRDARAAKSLLKQVQQVLSHDEPPTTAEADTLAAAEPLAAAPMSKPNVLRPPSPALKPETNTAREERRARRQALGQARSLIGRLRVKSSPAAERLQLIEELAPHAEAAGDWLSARERRDVEKWRSELTAAKSRRSNAGGAAATPAQPGAGRLGETHLTEEALTSAAAAVRGALKKAAREQSTTKWSRLRTQLGSALPRMTVAEKIRVLILVDQATPADEALLSSLVAAGDAEFAPHYRNVAAALGLQTPTDDAQLRDVIEADVQQVFANWRNR